MTADDRTDDQTDGGLAAPEDAVRRLLADARHDAPIPSDVAARLDRALAGLATVGRDASATGSTTVPTDPSPGVVVDLRSRRRRKVLVGLVAAAAVVVVGGIGVREVVTGVGGDDSAATADAPNAGVAADRGAAVGAEEKRAPDGSTTIPAPGLPGGLDDVTLPYSYSLRSSSFVADVTRLVRLDPALADLDALSSTASTADGGSEYSGGSGGSDNSDNSPGSAPQDSPSRDQASGAPALPTPGDVEQQAGPGCPVRGLGPGTLVPVVYDGRPAVLALRPPQGQSLVVDLLACGGTVLRSVTLPR